LAADDIGLWLRGVEYMTSAAVIGTLVLVSTVPGPRANL
jgi:hypothetical protein